MESLTGGNVEDATLKKYDLVVFGASGFTGQFVVEEVARTMDSEKKFTWAIAGRDMAKLQSVLSTASKVTETDLNELPIIIADVDVPSSLLDMCRHTRILLNCVGPYALYGTDVVKACIESGTHHVDICGEPGWLEKIHLVYDGKAKEQGVYILEACGFDSIPAEMGVIYTKRQFAGELKGVECFVALHNGPSGTCINDGTWRSAINGLVNHDMLKLTRRELYKTPMPHDFRLSSRSTVFYEPVVNSYCLPFIGADRSIVYRTQYLNWLLNKQSPVEFKAYFSCQGVVQMVMLMLIASMMWLLTKFSCGISLLEKFPSIFSLGFFKRGGPSRKQIAESTFCMTFIGRGYSKTVGDVTRDDQPVETIITRLTGPEIGYATTPVCMVQAAYILLNDADKLPQGGGVFTPGFAFSQTNLIERLERHGLAFSVSQK